MSTNPIDMLQTKGQMQAQDLQLKQNQVTSLNKSNISPAEKEKKLREACEGFESIFIQKMWQQMRATLPQENPLVGREEKFWQSMYDQELSKEMASSGGVGLADMMYNQLSKNLAAASRSTADTVSKNKGFEISATPLIPLPNANLADTNTTNIAQNQVNIAKEKTTAPEQSTQVASAPQAKKDAHSIYDGSAPHMGITPNANEQSTNNANNSPIVEQYLANLQSKQVSNSNQNLPTGPELARHARLVASNAPPSNGVLPNPNGPISGQNLQTQNVFVQPPSGANNTNPGAALLQAQISGQPMDAPHIVRTTYTTNIPESSKRKVNIQHLTSGQPMVHKLATPSYPYGSNKTSNDSNITQSNNVQSTNNAANTNQVNTTSQAAQQLSQTAAQQVAQGVHNTQVPIVNNTATTKNINEG